MRSRVCNFWLAFALCVGSTLGSGCVSALCYCGWLVVWGCFVFLFWVLGFAGMLCLVGLVYIVFVALVRTFYLLF